MNINQADSKFYIGSDENEPLAEMTFVLTGAHQLIINHTMVSEELRGQGVGEELLEKVAGYAKDNNRKIIPLCPFAKSQIEKDPEKYADVLKK